MNQIPIYQHPYVDVFKATKVTEWQTSQKEGDVTEVYDKTLAKNVIKVSGATPTSNYFQLPAQSQITKKPLGLIGKYIYAVVNVPAGKSFVLHFDYMVNETRLVRISVSNIFKEFKNLNGSSIQIPALDGSIPFNKWTIVCLNAQQILEQNQVFASGQKQSFFMRSLQVNANVQIKGIYTSDIRYTVQTLPKDMALKILKGQDWFQQYSWFNYPMSEGDLEGVAQNEGGKENSNSNNGQTHKEKKSAVKASSSGTGKTAKTVKFSNESKPNALSDVVEEAKNEEDSQSQDRSDQDQLQIGRETIERTLRDIEDIKQQFNLNLEEKNLQSKAEVTFYYDQDTSMYPKPVKKVTRTLVDEDMFVLKPNPIMKLDRVIGMHPQYQSGQVYFNKDAKLSREILYNQANLLLGYQHANKKQRLFYDHPTSTIEQLYVEGGLAFTVTRGGHSDGQQESQVKDFEVTIWDIQDAKMLFSFRPPLTSLHSISLNQQQADGSWYLCLSGKDFQKRDLIIIYNFIEMMIQKKVEIYARQLCDFDLANIRFNDAVPNALVACGRENIRLFKIKNGHLPGQMVTLNNTGRGKMFTRSLVDYAVNEKGQKKATYVYTTTNCGLLYFVNYSTRQIDKIIQIHEDRITTLMMSPVKRDFMVTASINGILRLWSPDFSKLISEVNTQQPILSCDINHKEIVVLAANGTISMLDMEESTFNVILRSHLDNVHDLCYNRPGGKVVSIGKDQKIYIWNSETMEIVTEFTTQNDLAIKLASSQLEPNVAVGFKSGFLRIFDLSYESSGKLIAETMIYESPIMDLQYSPDNRFLAVFYKSCRIVIFNVEKGYQPVKNIDYEFPNENYFSLTFSPDGKLLANISSNANNVTVWETKNFSLKFHLDVTGDIISKIEFAPNGKDLVLLTTSSKLKFYRVNFSDLQFLKEIYGLTDLECLDFEISPNNQFLACCGKEGVVKVYDYFMRGAASPSCQAFIGHFKHPKRVYWQDDMRSLLSIGDGNGIFKWSFFGDKEIPSDISRCFEEIEAKPQKIVDSGEPTFNHDDLLRMTNQQLDGHYNQLSEQVGRVIDANDPDQFPVREIDHQSRVAPLQSRLTAAAAYEVQYNAAGYRFEQYDIELKKVLQCSIGEQVKNNLVWNKAQRYIAYTSQNIIIIEDLNQEKTQRLLKEGNDKIFQLKISPNGRYLLAYTLRGEIDGFPCIYIWDAATLRKLNQIAINDTEIAAIEFSKNSNMLLVLSKSVTGPGQIVSCVAVWDFMDGHKDILCKSHIPLDMIDGRWNYYLGESNEFVTVSTRSYYYWKISPNLTLQYQEGEMPKQRDIFSSKDDGFTTCEFVVPTPEQLSIYVLLALNSGYVWVCDSRCNQFLYSVKVLDGSIRQIYTSLSKIIIEGQNDAQIHCWPQGQGDFDKSSPHSFFLDKERKLTIDGFPQATSYDEAVGECIMTSSSGTMWFVSWTENATLKLKSCHSPSFGITGADFKYIPPSQFQIEETEGFHQFDQNYSIASCGKDGVIKLWNMFDSEFLLQFIVPKEECVAIAMHQFKPYMIASFTDGFVRFFEIQNKTKTLGRCHIQHQASDSGFTDYIVSLKVLPSGNHILGASKNGQVILIYVQQWDPLAIKIEQLASINTNIHSFDVSFLEPYNKWLVGTSNGKVIVYNRKDFNAYQQELFNEENPPRFNFMDSFNTLDYVDNSFTESKRTNTLDHYYSVSKRNLVLNEVDEANRCTGVFSNADLTLHISFIAKASYLFIRNFELHQVVKRIALQSLPLQLGITPNSSFFFVLQQDNVVKMIDFVNTENTSEILTIHSEAQVIKICPNGRYVLTGGSKGDICIWQVKRREIIEEQQTE